MVDQQGAEPELDTPRSCALDAIELCLDTQMVVSSLRFLRNTRGTSEASLRKAIEDATNGWRAIKTGISQMENCGIRLVDERGIKDIDSNLSTLRFDSQFLDSDGPFVGNQIDRLIRFELLTSGGRLSRQ